MWRARACVICRTIVAELLPHTVAITQKISQNSTENSAVRGV